MSLLLKECRWCGNSFVPAHLNEAYCCTECRLEKRRDDDRAKAKSWRLRQKSKRVASKIVGGFPTIPDVVSATIEHKQNTGRIISYGKMVAIMEREGV